MTKDAAMGLINYVGTREGVELNVPKQMKLDGTSDTPLNLDPLKLRPEVASKPVTSKQLDTIAKLLEQFPDAKKTFEYDDFKTNPTIGNASELISRAAEIGLGYAVGIGEATNLVEYVGKRPGVDCAGEHGLFSSEPNVDIKKAQEEMANCKGNIWTHIVSLRREDADALGYDHQKPWRDLVMQKVDIIAKASNIPVSELHWYAGMHNTTHHPHIHLFVFSDNPKSGKLTVQGINKMKQEFSKEIFAEERLHIYEHKTEVRDEIKSKINSILSGIENHESDQFSKKELDALCGRLLHLSHDLEGKSARLQYGRLKKDLNIRSQVDGILSDLAKAPAIQELYKLYCEDHKDLQRMYRNNPKDIEPMIKNNEFDSIKNKILQEAVKLGKASLDFCPGNGNIPESADRANTDPVYSKGNPADYGTKDYEDSFSLLSDDESLFASVPDERPDNEYPEEFDQPAGWEPQENYEQEAPPVIHKQKESENFGQCLDKAMDGDSNARYRLAKMYFYGNGVEQDYIQAQVWYGLAAEGGNSLAKYELGKMNLYGVGIEKNPELGKEYCLDAYWSFRSSIAEIYGYDIGQHVDRGTTDEISGFEKAGYLMYCLGRMEHAGEGAEQDYGKAFRWFQLAADSSHVHSNYCLAKMYYGGEGVPQNYYNAKYFYEQAAKGKDKYAYHALGKMFDTGTGTEQDYSKAAEWFLRASQENVPYADYRLGQMFSIGQGVEKDEELSQILYRKALDEFIEQEKRQPNASDEFRIANMYLKGLGVEPNPEEAVKWLELCCEKKDPRAQFQLARMYQDGEAIARDEAKAQDLYAAALTGFLLQEQETPSASVEYKIAGFYDRGNGAEPDAAQAYSWYMKAAEAGHPHAAYKAAKCYFEGTGTEQNFESAEKWFIRAAEGGDSYAMYALGKMYRDGTGVETNFSTSYDYFLAAAELGHEFAQFAAAKALLYGIGIEKNLQLAMVFLKKCAERKNHYAEYQVGQMYENKKGLLNSDITAIVYYKRALEGFIADDLKNPSSETEYRIGMMFYRGKGSVVDYLSAYQWFSMSAEKGNSHAQFYMARMLEKGEGVNINKQQSKEFYLKAFQGFLKDWKENENPDTLYKIGTMHEFGLGVEKNEEAAKECYKEAAAAGSESAQERLKQIEDYEKSVAIHSIFGLFRAFSHNLGNNIQDSTTRKYRQDHKQLLKQRQLKAAHGQKEGLEQTM